MHCVFATKRRELCLTAPIRVRLWPYLGGIARENGMKMPIVGGVADHVHLLLSIPPTLPVANAMQLLKGNSSKWLHETFPELRSFAWQEGYGAFSIGISATDETVNYIRTQEEHHRHRTFQEEVELFLRKHGMTFDSAMLED
jgi:REP element-mobilizing transposase RayT